MFSEMYHEVLLHGKAGNEPTSGISVRSSLMTVRATRPVPQLRRMNALFLAKLDH
jgi:hypothetical protein